MSNTLAWCLGALLIVLAIANSVLIARLFESWEQAQRRRERRRKKRMRNIRKYLNNS